jgi:hypothetical protein
MSEPISSNPMGYTDPVRSAKFPTGVNKIMTRFGTLPVSCTLRQCKDVHHVIAQDHRAIKRRVNPGMGVGSVSTAQHTIQGYEAMPMVGTGQLNGVAQGEVLAQNRLIDQLFGLAAYKRLSRGLHKLLALLATQPPLPRLTDLGHANEFTQFF